MDQGHFFPRHHLSLLRDLAKVATWWLTDNRENGILKHFSWNIKNRSEISWRKTLEENSKNTLNFTGSRFHFTFVLTLRIPTYGNRIFEMWRQNIAVVRNRDSSMMIRVKSSFFKNLYQDWRKVCCMVLEILKLNR